MCSPAMGFRLSLTSTVLSRLARPGHARRPQFDWLEPRLLLAMSDGLGFSASLTTLNGVASQPANSTPAALVVTLPNPKTLPVLPQTLVVSGQVQAPPRSAPLDVSSTV